MQEAYRIYARGLIRDLNAHMNGEYTFNQNEGRDMLDELALEYERFSLFHANYEGDKSSRAILLILKWYKNHLMGG